MMYVIVLINTSRHAFNSMVGRGLRSQDVLGGDLIIFLTSAVVAGSNDNLVVESKHLQRLEYDL